MSFQIQLRRGLSGDWNNNNPILAQGEPGLELVTNKIKIGDGVTSWVSLSYYNDYQTLSFNEATGILSILNGNTVSLSALSGGGGTLTNETDPVFTTWAQANSGNYQYTFTTVNTNSGNWNYQGTDIKVLTGNWQNTYTTVNTNSSNWNYQGTDIKALTSNWQDTYTTVNTNSGNWNYQGTDIKALTSNWQNTYTTVNTNSSRYDSVFTTVNANSASWGTGGTGSGGLTGISYNRWSFTGSPPISAFSISGATSETEEAYRVTIDFLLQDPLSYTVSGTTITFSEAPPISSNIVVIESYAASAGGSSTGGTKTYAVFTPLDAQPLSSNFATFDTRNSIAVLDFDATTEEGTTFVGILPEGADVSSGLKVRLHWTATTATTGSCRWGVQFEKAGTDIDSDSFDTATENHSTTNGTAGIETITEIIATTIDSITAGDRFRMKVYRDATDAINDTMTGDAELIAVEIRSAV